MRILSLCLSLSLSPSPEFQVGYDKAITRVLMPKLYWNNLFCCDGPQCKDEPGRDRRVDVETERIKLHERQ